MKWTKLSFVAVLAAQLMACADYFAGRDPVQRAALDHAE